MFEIDGERYDLHGAPALTFVKTAARQSGDVELDRFGEAVDDVVHPRHFGGDLAIVVHDRSHDLVQHDLHGVAHAQRLARRIGDREGRRIECCFVEVARQRWIGRLFAFR